MIYNLYRLFAAILLAAFITLPTLALADKYDWYDTKWNVPKDNHKVEKPGDDKALVYFLRSQYLGNAITFWQFVDDKFISVVFGNQYSYAMVTPGEHILWTKAKNVNALKMNFEAGKTYYFQQKVKMGVFRAGVQLVLIEDETKLKKHLSRSKMYVTPTKRAHKKAAKYLSKFYEVAKKYAEQNKSKKTGYTYW